MALTYKARSLVTAGAWLFFFGLLQGGVVQMFANPRMALSAHLTALQSGLALMILGVVWSLASWSKPVEMLSQLTTVIGMYGLWLALTLAALTGASDALPIAGRGFAAPQTIEVVVSMLVVGSSGAVVLGWLLFLMRIGRPAT